MKFQRIAILGGSGFIGTSLCNRLVQDQLQLVVATRKREKRRSKLILLPALELVQADIHDSQQLEATLGGCDAVINLVGILNENGTDGKGFYHAHVALAEKLLDVCAKKGIRRILQMSALNASARNNRSHYLGTKGKAEDLLHNNKHDIAVTSFQPSVIFGEEDAFFNRFSRLLQNIPAVFPLACANTRLQPIYVLDVVEMMARSLHDSNSFGQRFPLVGAKTYTLKELLQITLRVIGRKRFILPLPDILARIQAAMFDRLGSLFSMCNLEKPFSMENYQMLQQDSVSNENGLKFYNMQPAHLEKTVANYLGEQNWRTRYAVYRNNHHF